jgi:hypothetical protein
VLVGTTAVVACSAQDTKGGGAESAADVYAIATVASIPSALPSCTPTLEGEVAYVVAPSSLWRCIDHRWSRIACTASAAGAVAYASTSGTLVACVGGSWVVVALPAGPQGPPGPQGSPGEAGANAPPPLIDLVTFEGDAGPCTAGGTEILAGVDENFDGQLEPLEIRATSYVCNGIGAPEIDDAGATSGDAQPDGSVEASPDASLDGALESSADGPACGDLGAPCCATGTPCSTASGFALGCQQGTCVPCGAIGGPCCTGARCNGAGVCFQPNAASPAVCAMAGPGNGPCSSALFCPNGASPGSACAPGFTCNGSPAVIAGLPVTATCVPCGTLGQPCCTNHFDALTNGLPTCGGQLCTDGSRCQPGPLQCVSP